MGSGQEPDIIRSETALKIIRLNLLDIRMVMFGPSK